MKKQIFTLVLLVVAIFATMSKSYGQEQNPAPAMTSVPTACLTPTPLDATLCTGNPLTPLVGVPYTYEVEVPNLAGTKKYKWFVTTDQTFITKNTTTLISTVTATIEAGNGSGSHILAAGTIPTPANGYGTYNDLTGTTGTSKIQMSWNYWVHNPANPVFLVVYVSNDSSCDNDNMKVYIIKPVHSFTLNIANVLPNGTVSAIGATTDGPCAAPISGAKWVAPVAGSPDGQIEMDYGVNYLYYIVNAANFNHSWLPSFQVSGAGIGAAATRNREVTAIDWQYSAQSNSTATWNPTKITYDATNVLYAGTGKAAGTAGADIPVVAKNVNGFVNSTGECIVVRVTVANRKVETVTNPDPITLAVDGVMYDAAAIAANAAANPYANLALGDIHHTAGPNAATDLTQKCPWTDLFANDKAIQNILVRPTINDLTAPAGTDFVPAKTN